jgi:hypothetical protein
MCEVNSRVSIVCQESLRGLLHQCWGSIVDRAAENNTLLEVKGLKKHFPVTKLIIFQRKVADIRAVDDVSFSIKRGETLGPVGGRVVMEKPQLVGQSCNWSDPLLVRCCFKMRTYASLINKACFGDGGKCRSFSKTPLLH